MKNTKSIIILAVILLVPQLTRAQGTVYLSNLDQQSAGNLAVGSDSWLAAFFNTGTNASGYFLDSAELGMINVSGNPTGFTVMLYSINPTHPVPGNKLATLNGSLNPATSDIFTYTPASTMILSANTDYFLVLTAATAVADGAFEWSYVDSNVYNPSGGWGTTDGVFSSNNGSSWPGGYSGNPQFAISATAIPEPGIVGLLALGGLGLLWHRRKAMPASEPA